MKIIPISNLIEGEGSIIYGNKELIKNISTKNIVKIFEKYGIIIFRDYQINKEEILNFTDRFTLNYAGDAVRRSSRFGKKSIRNVDAGNKDILLHSEASFSKSWPEIIWFFCITPPIVGGKTTICDGIKLWKQLETGTKEFFLTNPILYKLKIPIGKKNPNKDNQKWFINEIGMGNSYINWKKGTLNTELLRFPVQLGRNLKDLCFANHLFVSLKSEPQILSRTLINNKKIPTKYLREIKDKAKKLTFEISWNKNDLIMIDNKRFMHGRKTYPSNDPRDIVNIQTEKANFSYGSTLITKN